MKSKVLIVPSIDYLWFDEKQYDIVIGVDQGAGYLIANQRQINLAIGDFDSISKSQWKKLQQANIPIIRYPAMKDETDGELAMRYVAEHYHGLACDYVSNGHDYAFIWPLIALMISYRVNVMTEQSYAKCYSARAERYLLKPLKGYFYISFIALHPAVISVTAMKYPVDQLALVDLNPIALRNEFLDQEAWLTVKNNPVVVIWSK